MKLNYRIFGDGQPMIILHGLFGSSDNWLTIGKKFAEKYSVYLLDLRNHGLSPHNDNHEYQTMTDDLNEFIIDHGLENIILLGHSMGGKVSMNFAINYPDKVDKLIIVDISPKKYQHDNLLLIEAMLSLDIKAISSRDQAEKFLSEKIPDKSTRLFLLKNLYRKDDLSFAWRLNLNALKQNIITIEDSAIENIFLKKTFFLQGENSKYITDSDYPLIKKLFPNSIIKKISGAGHWLHAEKPEIVFNEINMFLQN
ncbi:MAG: alpha/beta fold hydrolase [Candidatus Sericytochromatia bacterium]|nr:alpha/beta fold hydrolase [Candidatus Sericytochromatia bacterium]